MMLAITLTLATLMTTPPPDHAADGVPSPSAESKPSAEDALIDRIVTLGCRGNHATRKMVVELMAIEKDAGFPEEARGLLAAASCNESGFKPFGRGDWRSQTTGRRCRRGSAACAPTSLGIVQFGAWAKRGLRRMGSTMPEPRFDWRIAARFWAKHVAAQVSRVRAQCPRLRRGWDKNTPEVDVWRAAHRTAVMFPKCGEYRLRKGRQKCVRRVPRCHRLGRRYKSAHWRILSRWRGEDVQPLPKKWQGIPRAVRLTVVP